MERCELTDLMPDQCACKNHRANRDHIPELESPPATVWSRLGRPRPIIAAKWPNKCPECGIAFAVGELITPEAPNSRKWIHLECANGE